MIQIANIFLRGITLASKFLLIFFLAKFLDPVEVGIYGLIAATTGYALYVVGFEFYNFSNREMIGEDPRHWLRIIRDQTVLYLILYALFLPFGMLLFLKGWLPWKYISWFFGLVLFEHVAQELNRILVAISHQLLASFVLFLRSGAWCLIVAFAMWLSPEARNLDFMFGAWTICACFACALAVIKLLSFDNKCLRAPIDWVWIKSGIKVALPLLAASLAVRGMFTFDRYFVENITSLDVLGPYVLFIGIATAILSFLDAGVIVFFYPKLVSFAKAEDYYGFKKCVKGLTLNIVVVTFILAFICFLISEPLLRLLDKPLYIENLFLLYWLLIGVIIYALSTIPHLGLYSFGKDKPIFLSQVVGFFVFLAVSYCGGNYWGVIIIPWAMCLAFSVILVWKLISYHLMRINQKSLEIHLVLE